MNFRNPFPGLLRAASIAAIGALWPVAAAASGPTVDDTARVLAGLPPAQSSALEAITSSEPWQAQAAKFSEAWQRLEERQLSHARGWADRELAGDRSNVPVLYYAFSGPDILYANTFFPDCGTYVLCGLEPAGKVPDLASLSPAQAGAAVRGLHASLGTVLALSFFKTKDMQTDLRNTLLPGTTPILLTFLARLGKTVRSAVPVGLDADGNELPSGTAPEGVVVTPGVRIEFDSGPGTPVQTVYYFTTDLSNGGLERNPAFANFCRKLPEGGGFLKAASYLMHNGGFSGARDLLMERCKFILQDDTGIPAAAFTRNDWQIEPHGRYAGPINMFRERYQKDLAKIFADSAQVPLGFGISYHHKKRDCGLVVARRGAASSEAAVAVAAPPAVNSAAAPEPTPPPALPVVADVVSLKEPSPKEALRALEIEELRIRADASLSRKERLRLLREVWNKQLAVTGRSL